MTDIAQFFSIDSFMPHGHCYLWRPSILWLNVLSDAFIALSYVSIPISLLYILHKRKDLPFSWIFVAFGAFIVSCGMTHVMEMVTVWIPLYAIAGLLKLFTALVSILTAILLIKLTPLILILPSPVQLRIANDNLQSANERLQKEIVARQNSEENLRKAYDKLTLLNKELVTATEKAIRADVLEKSERRFYSIVEGAPHGQLVVNQDGKIELANQQIEKIFGYTRDQLMGQSVDMLLPEKFRHHHMQFRVDYFTHPEMKSMGAGRELYGLRENGQEVPLEIGLNPIEFDDGMKVLCSIIDITERKDFIDELARSNKELENFAYVASHDLKSPLRAVDQLATWLHEDLNDKLDEEHVSHLNLMRGRIKRMEKLLDDLLAYSRVSKKDNNLILTNTQRLVESVFDMCNATNSFKLILQGSFPEFVTASIPLEQVFRNLISNAIKHHGASVGEITINVTSNEKFYLFSVADDGQGILPEHEELAFSMFQTLRPRDEVEGSGMGLAIVKKIVELFGGSIHLEQNKPVGARFIFSWRK